MYLVPFFVPLFQWLPDYETESRPTSRMVLTLLIWGFLAWPYVGLFFGLTLYVRAIPGPTGGFDLLPVYGALVGLGVLRIFRGILRHQAAHAPAGRIHLTLLSSLALAGLIAGSATDSMTGGSPRSTFGTWLGSAAAYLVIRPILFSGAVVRYQMFGAGVRMDRAGGVLAGLAGGILAGGAAYDTLGPAADAPAVGIGVLVAVGIALLAGAVSRFLPRLAEPAGRLLRPSARDVYLVNLRTALYQGRIVEPDDARVLGTLRQRQGVSDREHALLVEELLARERAPGTSGGIRTLLLLAEDGRLICSVNVESLGAVDADIVAGMLVAIRTATQEGLGGHSPLETMRFGDQSVVVEADRPFVVIAGISGGDAATHRERIRGWLESLVARHGPKFGHWDGSDTGVDALQSDLRALVGQAPRGP